MAKRTASTKGRRNEPKSKSPKSAKSTKSTRTTKNAKVAKPRKTAGATASRARTDVEMSTSVLEGPMKSLIAEALMKRK
ncbi:hypothetical protein [Rhodospirillaceae bacterium SYSU D60014]|uniref:hypothetical protein n=1 Tax=Virgifigura deserti TaxID=2268457 RepID=UPI000E665292